MRFRRTQAFRLDTITLKLIILGQIVLIFLMSGILFAMSAMAVLAFKYWNNLPSLEPLEYSTTNVWEVPTKIYSDLCEIKLGDSKRFILNKLNSLRYRQVSGNTSLKEGEFRGVRGEGKSDLGGVLQIYLRGFSYPRAKFEAQLVSVEFDSDSVSSIKSSDGNLLDSFIFEPELIDELYSRRGTTREIVRLDQVPLHLKQAFLAAEDKNFYKHWGLSVPDIARAAIVDILVLVNLRKGFVQGGSTITQQLAKNLFLTREQTIQRKTKEILLTIRIERRFSKDQILERYLNQVNLGRYGSREIYGVQQAAYYYFKKPISNLTLGESALLAGIVQSPSRYSLVRNLDRALQRRKVVLSRMLKNKFIAEAEMKAVETEPMRLESASIYSSEAPYFVDHVEKMLEGKYETRALHTEGMKVYTTLDLSMQRAANKAIYEGLNSLDAKLRLPPYAEASSESKTDPLSYPQAALVALEPQTGFIKAMVGGRDYGSSQFNRSVQAQRQPGSAFKPFVFATAFNASLVTPSKIISDEPWSLATSSGIWKPDNYDEDFKGEVTLRNVLIHSINVPTAKLLYYTVGIRRTIQLAKKMGITSPLAPYPALALGSSVVTLLELTSAYGVFANRGVRVEPVAIKYVQSRTGEILEEFQPQAQKVLEENVAYLMTDLMKGVINEGTARRLRAMDFKRIAAGKTGTTNNKTDASFIGYIPTLVAGVWSGYDDPQKSVRHTGGEVAAPIWANFMEQAAKAADQDFPVSPGIVFKEVDANTGLLASRRCGRVIREAFIEGMEPTRICNAHN